MSFSSPFPPEFSFCYSEFAPDAPLPLLLPEEQALLSPAASVKRIREFSYGRSAAHSALVGLGISPTTPVLRGKDREPRWPEGIKGAISHSGFAAAAVVTKEPAVIGVGLDLECRSTRRSDISSHVATPAEQQWIDQAPDRAAAVLLLFSAKESLYKAMYYSVQKYIGFMDVELLPEELNAQNTAPSGRLRGRVIADSIAPFRAGYPFVVSYCWSNDRLLTSTVLY